MKRVFKNRKYIIGIWILLLFCFGYAFVFFKDTLSLWFTQLFLIYPIIWYFVYLLFVSIRGLTFIPLITILLVMVPFTNHWALLITTLVWTLITSYIIYRFSEVLEIDDYFERKHPRAIKALHRGFEKYELPIIIVRSLLPFTPTDLICYIAGTLQVNVRKMLLWLLIGEVIICSFYIWGIKTIIS